MQDIIAKGITHGVYIVTARTKDKINGMTAAWISQVSFQPLMLVVSIAPARYTYGLIKESGYFAVNTLAEGQEGIAQSFGFRSGRKVDKFKNVDFFDAPHGSPVLSESFGFVECRLAEEFRSGDHSLFIGEVTAAKLLDKNRAPLIFHWDDYF